MSTSFARTWTTSANSSAGTAKLFPEKILTRGSLLPLLGFPFAGEIRIPGNRNNAKFWLVICFPCGSIWRMGKTAVGSDVEAYCTKCKMVLAHSIVAMEGTKPRRVRCNTCNGEHNYRADEARSEDCVQKDGEKRAKKATTKRTRQSWEEVMQEASAKPHKKYSMSGSFGEGDWIEHATFGLGCVQTFVAPNKITVRFADSTRMLVCNQS